jgi:hypothetical protein
VTGSEDSADIAPCVLNLDTFAAMIKERPEYRLPTVSWGGWFAREKAIVSEAQATDAAEA